MELKDLLPLFGIAIGWLLAEGSAFGKRLIERRRTVGKALSVLYFLFMEMVQVKMAQERFKNLGNDVKEWERLRQRSFEKYTSQDAAFMERLNATADSLGEYYPIEAYKFREVLTKYQFVKSKKLDVFTTNPGLYVSMRILAKYSTDSSPKAPTIPGQRLHHFWLKYSTLSNHSRGCSH